MYLGTMLQVSRTESLPIVTFNLGHSFSLSTTTDEASHVTVEASHVTVEDEIPVNDDSFDVRYILRY